MASVPAILALVLVGAGCSFTTSDVAECQSSQDCQSAFGFGYSCGNDGYCGQLEHAPRCLKTFPEDLFQYPENYRDAIVIGNLMDRSLATHQARENAAQLALAQVNAAGGVGGRLFASVFCTIEVSPEFDAFTRQEAAVASARYLIDEIGVPAIVGPAASGDTQAVFQSIFEEDVLIISPSATSPSLSGLESPPFTDLEPGRLWRTAPPDSLQGQAIAADMTGPGPGRAAGVNSVAVVYEDGAYGDGLLSVFELVFDGTVSPFPYTDPSVMGESINAAGSAPVQEVLFISSQSDDVTSFLNAAAAPSFDGKSIFLTDAAANSDVLSNGNSARFNDVRGSRPAPLDPVNDYVYSQFLISYATEFGEQPVQYSFVAHAYDSAWLVALGAAWSLLREGSITGTNIAKGLRQISNTELEPIQLQSSNWAEALQGFVNGEAINIEGASGPLDYDSSNEETSANIEIWRIQNEQIDGIYNWAP